MSNIDLNNLPPDLTASVNKKETDGERRVRLIKDLVIFIAAVFVVSAAFVWAAWVLVSGQSPTLQPFAISTASAIIGGLLGYLLKK